MVDNLDVGDAACEKSGHPYLSLGTEKKPSTTTRGMRSPLLVTSRHGQLVEKNGNVELSITASMRQSRVSKFVARTGRFTGNNSR
mmetsp:Transcript_13777/g.40283  ORF Transcript_13777/g.40283 Transcript_13777/m.40283 type:complete len:85 (+) Transcript_13777:429-683(+)